MSRVKIAVFQKHDDNLEILNSWLDEYIPHEKIAESSKREYAAYQIFKMKIGKLAMPDVILLDGNLSDESIMCSDAKYLIKILNIYNLKPKIIGYSDLYLCENGIQIPEILDIGKDPKSLSRVINQNLGFSLNHMDGGQTDVLGV